MTETWAQFAQSAPANIDLDAVRADWDALAPRYDVSNWLLPVPPWYHRPYDHDGERSWHELRERLSEPHDTPMCIYLHVPFCTSKCGFCDSYSFKLGAHIDDRLDDYVEILCAELRLWAGLPGVRTRPVTSVHLGGGTPTFLGPRRLERIVQCCRECFAVGPQTEWALESTVQCLTPEMIETMHALGFRRLHIGAQSTEDQVRAIIGRRTPARELFATIEATRALGWVVSVDLICGLPLQTPGGFFDGISRLLSAGTNGFSLYEFLVYPQNQRWADRHGVAGRNHALNFLMLVAADQLLEARGFRKNLFNHWADDLDENIYFTFPTRGEDLLAIGSIADGIFGDYQYRHPRYAPYADSVRAGRPGLEGGLQRNAVESQLSRPTVGILSGRIQADTWAGLGSLNDDGIPLGEHWSQAGLARPDAEGNWQLTGSGSWFAGNMMTELVDSALRTPENAN